MSNGNGQKTKHPCYINLGIIHRKYDVRYVLYSRVDSGTRTIEEGKKSIGGIFFPDDREGLPLKTKKIHRGRNSDNLGNLPPPPYKLILEILYAQHYPAQQ